jgi:hypothetical protein
MRDIVDKYPDGRVAGFFELEPGLEIFGDLKLKGPRTVLDLRHRQYFATRDLSDQCIKGTLHDLVRVTLLGCNVTSAGTASRHNEGYYTARAMPSFVAFGDVHLSPRDPVVESIGFTIDDAAVLFHDHESFGSLMDAAPFIEKIAKANKPERVVSIGPHPQIHYFTGKTEILRSETCLGVLTVNHHPTWGLGGPSGVRMDNTIGIKLEFSTPRTFRDSVNTIYPLLRFFELMIGRPQNISDLWLRLPDIDDRPNTLDLYWTHPLQRDERNEGSRPHLVDVLISPIKDTAQFSQVLASWLERDNSRRTARVRFSQAFGLQNWYPHDRTVGAANMFDLLPDDAVPARATVQPQILATKEECRRLFKELPPSLEREAMLQALGRIGKSSLRHKIRHRAKPILEALERAFPQIDLAIDEAVTCRNFFVHGDDPSFDYEEQLGTTAFLTDTLEFVFGASDLVEAGWEIRSWAKRHATLSHPYASYRHNYELNIRELRKLLAKG